MGERHISSDLRAMKKAVVLLSGGLDSATTLYYAVAKGYRCFCLVFDYGQRHAREIASARKIANKAGYPLEVLKISLPWKGSSLLDRGIKVPGATGKNPSTYVPARNMIFLSFALSYAEAIKAQRIFIGANAIDYSGYPDCRPDFIRAFQAAAAKGTNSPVKIDAPLINKTKKDIVKLAIKLKVPLELTWSCYKGKKRPCGTCDSCRFRAKGFSQAGLEDPGSRGG